MLEKQIVARTDNSSKQSLTTWYAFWKNPIVYKELRGRMRGWRAFIILTAYLSIISIVIGGVVGIFAINRNSLGSIANRTIMGRVVFGSITAMELLMISVTAPALMAGSISNEKERQTYDLLRSTPLSPGVLITGKMISVLGFVYLLLFTSLPLHSLTILIGGVTYQEILLANLVLMVTAFTYCSIGVFFSSIFPHTSVATISTYVVSLLNLIGIPIGLLGLLYYFQVSVSQLDAIQMGIVLSVGWLFVAINPIASVVVTEIMMIQYQSVSIASLPLQGGVVFPVLSPWIGFVTTSALFSAVLLFICIRYVINRNT